MLFTRSKSLSVTPFSLRFHPGVSFYRGVNEGVNAHPGVNDGSHRGASGVVSVHSCAHSAFTPECSGAGRRSVLGVKESVSLGTYTPFPPMNYTKVRVRVHFTTSAVAAPGTLLAREGVNHRTEWPLCGPSARSDLAQKAPARRCPERGNKHLAEKTWAQKRAAAVSRLSWRRPRAKPASHGPQMCPNG